MRSHPCRLPAAVDAATNRLTRYQPQVALFFLGEKLNVIRRNRLLLQLRVQVAVDRALRPAWATFDAYTWAFQHLSLFRRAGGEDQYGTKEQ